jgi:hypothetical protein
MAVNAGAFIKPAFILAGIRPDYDGVFSGEVEEVRDIVGRAAIAAEMTAHITVVDPDFTIAEDPVKLQYESFAGIGPVGDKGLAIPSDTVFREEASYGMISVRIHISVCYVFERKGDDPVMGQLYGSPAFVVEVHFDAGIAGVSGFSEDIGYTIIKVPVRVRRMSQVKFPAFVKINMSAKGDRRGGLRLCRKLLSESGACIGKQGCEQGGQEKERSFKGE